MCISSMARQVFAAIFVGIGCLAGGPATAQNFITQTSGSTFTEKMVFAVYDIRGTEIPPELIQEIVLNGMKLYAREARVRQSIPPALLPPLPGRMVINGQRGECSGNLYTIIGMDSSMAKYGEMTLHQACLFPYAGGYRLNYYALFGQQSGVGSGNPNVLAAMLGRVMTNAVGLGDSSKFISKVLDKIEGGFKEQNIGYKLVEFHPANQEGRVAVADDWRPSSADPVAAVAPPMPSSVSNVNLPPATMPLATTAPAVTSTPGNATATVGNQLAARRDLRAIGLEYFSQEQFVDAVRRGDKLAVELFLSGGGVDPTRADKTGTTPLKAAANRAEIRALLQANGTN